MYSPIGHYTTIREMGKGEIGGNRENRTRDLKGHYAFRSTTEPGPHKD